MKDYQFSLLSTLYLFGKRLHSLAKRHNNDQMSTHILLHVVSLRPYSISEIADMLSIKISAATSRVTEMEKSGLLKRNMTGDKRTHTVSITKKGIEMLNESDNLMSNHPVDEWFGLSKKECQIIETLLSRIRLEDAYAEKN